MLKRKLSQSSLSANESSPGQRDPVDSELMTKVPRLSSTQQEGSPTQRNMPTELLDWILLHEEGFQRRLQSLYGDFRIYQTSSPETYHANINAWKKALVHATRAGVLPGRGGQRDLLSIHTGTELDRALDRNGRPAGLPAVFADAMAKKEMIPLKDFLELKTSVYHKSWIPSPWTVLRWGLRQIGLVGQPGQEDKPVAGDFVVLSNVEAASNEILEQIKSATSSVDLILSRSEFLNRFAHVLNPTSRLSSTDLNILLVHLSRDKQALSYNAQTIKFKPETQSIPLPITQEDTAIVSLRDTLNKIKAQIPPIEEKVAQADAASKQAVREKRMVQAKAALRQKKLAESALVQRTDVVLQLETIYAQLQQAADQVEIVSAIKAGSEALKGLNLKVGGAEGVQGVMDSLREEMDVAEEINTIINESGEPVDEGEIDEEFAEMERQEREKREAEEAKETARRLAELERVERERKEKEAQQEQEKQKAQQEEQAEKQTDAKEEKPASLEDDEEEVEQAQLSMSRLSMQEEESPEKAVAEKEGAKEEPMAA